MPGPLQGLKVIEMAGLGPAPFCAMLLADMGAHVVRIERPQGGTRIAKHDVTARGRSALVLDLRSEEDLQALWSMIDSADVLIEGFRPGVMERLGLGPQPCLQRRPSLVYGRMTGWGQHGPLAQAAGHDINYISISGALHGIGTAQAPIPPLNLVGDFGGGAMLLAFGVLAALHEARSSGQGQVVDAAMTDGSALLAAMMYGFRAGGEWSLERQSNMLDGGAHYYGTYQCADEKWISIGPIEPQFYALFLDLCGVDDIELREHQNDRARWPQFRERIAALFRTRPRDAWCALLEGTDVCFAPVLDWDEAPRHPHNVARETFVELDGVVQPAAAPRFSRTPGQARPATRATRDEVLAAWQRQPGK